MYVRHGTVCKRLYTGIPAAAAATCSITADLRGGMGTDAPIYSNTHSISGETTPGLFPYQHAICIGSGLPAAPPAAPPVWAFFKSA